MDQPIAGEQEIKTIADMVYSTSGIVFKDSNLTVLLSRLSSKLKEKNVSSSEYIQLLKNDKQELLSFIDFVTTNFTSFFRNLRQFEMLRDDILPAMVKRNSESKTIKIWSAACSSGEEPYTIAMVANDFFESNKLYESGWSFHITGSDISLESLFIAKEGKFPAKSVQKIEPVYLQKYFIPVGENYMIKEDLKKMVRFDFHNLIYDNGIREVDITFCRNVLIYFDEDIQKKVVQNIYESMKPASYLFIGHSESLIGLFNGFKPVNLSKGIIYVKQ